MGFDLDKAIETVWENAQRGIHYPDDLKGKITLEQAYLVQMGILKRHLSLGRSHIGWKVGLTSKAMQEQQRAREPVLGFFLDGAAQASGVRLKFDSLIRPAFENELCLTIGSTLRGPGVTAEQARRAVAEVAPALELPERRGEFGADLAMDVADGIQAQFFVTGAVTSPLPADLDLGRAAVEVFINGESRDRAEGTAVMGSPANSVAWLANKLAELGMELPAGMRVMSGSFTKQYALSKGDHVLSRFVPFGEVEAVFE